jgi:hypothetical protein
MSHQPFGVALTSYRRDTILLQDEFVRDANGCLQDVRVNQVHNSLSSVRFGSGQGRGPTRRYEIEG